MHRKLLLKLLLKIRCREIDVAARLITRSEELEALAAGIRRDAQSPAGQVGRLDFDPLHDAQDFAVHDFRLADEAAPGGSDRARVRAAYRDGDHAVEVVFELSRREPEGWRIEDIRYGRGRSLSELLRSP